MTGHTPEELAFLQSLPLEDKVKMTRARIEEWMEAWQGGCYVSLSGGKDSAVLLHLVRALYPGVPAVFADTGLEHPEVRRYALSQENVTAVRPKKPFWEVVRDRGYPVISKYVAGSIACARRYDPLGRNRRFMHGEPFIRRDGTPMRSRFDLSIWQRLAEEAPFRISDVCCDKMKKEPLRAYERATGRKPFIATLAGESQMRRQAWLRGGCNAFSGHIRSTPMAFWREQDVLAYIERTHLPIAPVYGQVERDRHGLYLTGASRTGCLFCGFGAHLEKGEGRFVQLNREWPKLGRYCLEGGEWMDNPDYDPALPERAQDGFRTFNPKKLWVPSREGRGLRFVLETVNRLCGRQIRLPVEAGNE